ncbi:hydroxypyruvate isomerase family protein [Paracoccus aestuariivivens]|uniref:TIM barrel protein n=1 Tax=Paracoccus aestuariivivens TaxID=1820333 RepID=A0A6L6JFN4_9RHOB|nr:TIM barrel protein [Paracoccus aestuariivivens]MTH78701.1 TIM barrel protein [Paracoccus aestuariivivens]
MARFAANLTYLFTELPMLQRFAAARRAGFDGVEILFPYDLPVKDLQRAAEAEGLEFILMNTPPPNWAGGPRGFAAKPGNEGRFRSDFDRALRFAAALKVKHLHVMAGRAKGAAARQTLVDNLKWAAARAPRISLTIEPINTRDNPGYFLNSFDLAAEVVTEVGAANVGLQFDAYQAQMIHGHVLPLWEQLSHLTRHVQIAGCPGRHEPSSGNFEFTQFLRALEASNYDGWIGAEYLPSTSTNAGIGWLRSA